MACTLQHSSGNLSKFCKSYPLQQAPEEGRLVQQPKRCSINKDDDISPTVNSVNKN